jgi:predicted transcriptional regulator
MENPHSFSITDPTRNRNIVSLAEMKTLTHRSLNWKKLDIPIFFYSTRDVGKVRMQRGRVDSVASILRSSRTNNGLSKKKLQTESDLPAELLNDYLSTMLAKNLIEFDNAKNRKKGTEATIRITERGIKFLELYDAIKIKYFTAASARK